MFESITRDNYEAALALVWELMDAQPGMLEGEELDRLASLVDKYEREHFLIDQGEVGR